MSPAQDTGEMFVVKRDGRREAVSFDKITRRISRLAADLDTAFVSPILVAQGVVKGLYSGVSTSELDNLAAETAAYMSAEHPQYGQLAARVAVSNLQKDTSSSFAESVDLLYNWIDPKTEKRAGFISDEVYRIVQENKDLIESKIVHERDFLYDYFGFKTLEKSYLLRAGEKIVERPQYMIMRVALGIHGTDLGAAFETYELMSQKWFTHASPTLFHAGTRCMQMSSCFLLNLLDDSIEGIYDTLRQCALISKSAGGIGLSVSNIRAKGSYIKGTRGTSNGLVPMLRVFDATARYVDQGGGKRPGAFAIYIEPWHSDIFDVLELKKNTGKEEARARNLFYGLWVPDLFMKRVEEDGMWSLMCPSESAGLDECWGQEFVDKYTAYERAGKFTRRVRARELWYAILDAQIETGTPYMLYKDACNGKSNQQHIGTIRCSNLCTEIVEYTSKDEVAVCNLASICLPMFVSDDRTATESDNVEVYTDAEGNRFKFDHGHLQKVTAVMTRNLNKIIDMNSYPLDEAHRSNMRHRPIGLGVQGLADVFQKMRLPFDCPEARRLNADIFETMYFAAVDTSCELARRDGYYPSFPGSPASQGLLQPDLWRRHHSAVHSEASAEPPRYSSRHDWTGLKARIAKHGLRNSLLLAPMPTASTAQILGNNECIEPYTSNMYVRRVRAGEFIVVNPHLMRDLIDRGLWSDEMKNMILANGGSVQGLPGVPADVQEIYRTVWEIKQRSILDMAADRGAYIDQSQSLNCFVKDPDYDKLTSMHFHGWRRGLKTGMYYLRTKAAANAIQFTVDQSRISPRAARGEKAMKVDDDDDDDDSDGAAPGSGDVYGEACINCSG